jgi:hypothetical protein
MNKLGVHVFEQYGDLNWELEIVTFNLISALSWKRFQGPIHLYCNQEFLNTLEKWGVETVYDYINVDVLQNKPNDIDYKQYWAFSKFIVLDHLVNKDQSFTLLDNDLWIRAPLEIDDNLDVVMYHEEEFDLNFHKNIYVDFDYMLPDHLKSLNLDKSILPTNGALLYVKNSKNINHWIKTSFEVARFNFGKSEVNEHSSTKMCFIEQRLLPILLSEQKLNYGTFISQKYITQNIDYQDGSEWCPRLENSTNEEQIKFYNIKHVWGMKKVFKYKELWQLVISSTLTQLLEYDLNGKPYEELVMTLVDNFNNSITNS